MVEDLWTAGSETPVLLYKNIFFKEHLQWLLLTVSGSSLKLYSLKETLAKMFICECCKIFKNIFRQNTSGWLHLWNLRNFPDHFFYRAPLGNCLFNAQVTGFQPQDTIHRWDLPPPPSALIKGGGRTFEKLSHFGGGTKFFARKGG